LGDVREFDELKRLKPRSISDFRAPAPVKKPSEAVDYSKQKARDGSGRPGPVMEVLLPTEIKFLSGGG